jgi:hypothetical protein
MKKGNKWAILKSKSKSTALLAGIQTASRNQQAMVSNLGK